MRAGLVKDTQSQYGNQINVWLKFCREMGYDPIDPSDENIVLFMAFLATELKKSGGVIEKYLTAINHHFRMHKINWARSGYLKYALRSFKIRYPKQTRIKKPITHEYIWWIWCSFYNPNDLHFTYFAYLIAINIGYWLGCRPCEYCLNPKLGITNKFESIKWRLDSNGKPIEMILYFYAAIRKGGKHLQQFLSKTNKLGEKIEILPIKCQCGQTRFGLPSPCLVHAMWHYQIQRAKRFGKIQKSDWLLVNGINEVIKYDKIRCFLHKAIIKMAKITGVQLLPWEYTPHALRTGGTTDQARLGATYFMLKSFGRWESDDWQQTYISLDFYDLSVLRGETITDIRMSMKNCMAKTM